MRATGFFFYLFYYYFLFYFYLLIYLFLLRATGLFCYPITFVCLFLTHFAKQTLHCLTRCTVFLFQERIVQDLSKLSKAEKIQVHIIIK